MLLRLESPQPYFQSFNLFFFIQTLLNNWQWQLAFSLKLLYKNTATTANMAIGILPTHVI